MTSCSRDAPCEMRWKALEEAAEGQQEQPCGIQPVRRARPGEAAGHPEDGAADGE